MLEIKHFEGIYGEACKAAAPQASHTAFKGIVFYFIGIIAKMQLKRILLS